jgi:NRAMP (natural resistance-associated macrophage protein)-like metal ion transporter
VPENKVERAIEEVVAAPAEALEKAAATTQDIAETITSQKPIQGAKDFWHGLGPGLTTGASDDDPSGIATYSQTGAQFGFQLLWLAIFTFPLMAVVQEMCARIGLVTGRGLAGNIRLHYAKWVLYVCSILLLVANVFNIGADLGAMAKATQLLEPQINFGWLVFLFALASLLMQIFINYAKYAKYLKYLAFVLLAYIFTAFMIKDFDWVTVAKSAVVPSLTFSKEQLLLVCGILGTTISPYLFFWQTSQEIEDEIAEGKTTIASREGTNNRTIKEMRLDVWSGMFLSNVVMFFIIAVCAATLFSHGIYNISSAAQAAEALRPFAGNNAFLLFAVGIIGTGLLAVPVLAGSAAYALSESFGWKYGLNRKLKQASAFYGVIIIAMIVGFVLNFVGLDPIKALLYSAVLNGLVAPIILILVVAMSSNKQIMGDRTNHPFTTFLGWLIIGIMIAAGLATIASLILG